MQRYYYKVLGNCKKKKKFFKKHSQHLKIGGMGK